MSRMAHFTTLVSLPGRTLWWNSIKPLTLKSITIYCRILNLSNPIENIRYQHFHLPGFVYWGSAYNYFGYNEHSGKILCIEIIYSNVRKVGYKQHLLPIKMFLLQNFPRCNRYSDISTLMFSRFTENSKWRLLVREKRNQVSILCSERV